MVYTEAVLYDVLDQLCVDTDQVHVSGMSNGGMFIWTRIMERLSNTIATAGDDDESKIHQNLEYELQAQCAVLH